MLETSQEVNSLSRFISLFRVLIFKQSTLAFEGQYRYLPRDGRLMSDRICGQFLHPLRSMTETVVSLRSAFMEMQKFAYSLLGHVNLYLLFQFCSFGVDFLCQLFIINKI